MKKYFSLALALLFILVFVTGARAVDIYNDGEIVIDATNLYPKTDGGSTLGKTGNEFACGYFDSLVVNGATYTSFAAGSDGNWTDTGLTLTLDQAPTKIIATFSSGDFAATGFTVGTGDLTFAQGGVIDGDTNGTLKLIEASDTLSFIFPGTTIQLDSSDGGFQFKMTDATEGYVDFLTNNDTSDYLRISTVADVPTIVTAGTCNLEIAPDGGTTTVTGALTATGLVTATGGVTSSTTVTLQNSETIVNSTNNTVEIGGGTGTTLSVLDTGTSDSDAVLLLRADASTDNGDDWQIVSDGGTNSLFIQNDTGGSQATIATLSTAGLLTLTGGLTLADAEAISNASDVVILTADDAAATVELLGFEANVANLQLYADQDDDATDGWNIAATTAGTLTIGNDSAVAGTDVTKVTIASTGIVTLTAGLTFSDSEVLTTASDALILTGDDNDTAFRVLGFEAKEARLQLNADQDDDATDGWEIASSIAGTLTIGNDSSAAGTYLDKLTLSSAGVLTLVDSETITNASDVVTIGADDAAGALVVAGFEANASSIAVWSDEGDDAADKFTISMSAADALTMTTGVTQAVSIDTAGLSTLTAATVTGATLCNGTVGLGNAVGDIITVTGKVAGATPLSFDGNTADAVYTIFAMDDPASASKTITFPAVTGTAMLASAATALTPAAAVTLTVAKGNQLFTDTVTDNEDQTITFSGAGAAGDLVTIIFTCAGTADEVITFHATLVSSTGTLTCGTTAARYYVVQFVSSGAHWYEVSRTAVQT